MKQGARSSLNRVGSSNFFMFSQVLRESGFQRNAPIHPTDRATLHPSIHPPAAFSCSHPEAGVLRRQLRRQIRPPSNHGRSVARSGHWPIRDFSCAPLAAKRRRRKEGALLTHASPAPHVRSSLPLSFPSGRFGAVARHTIPQGSSPTPLAPSSCSVGRMQKHHHHRLRSPSLPPSGSANMAQTDELVLAFAFALHRNGDRR